MAAMFISALRHSYPKQFTSLTLEIFAFSLLCSTVSFKTNHCALVAPLSVFVRLIKMTTALTLATITAACRDHVAVIKLDQLNCCLLVSHTLFPPFQNIYNKKLFWENSFLLSFVYVLASALRLSYAARAFSAVCRIRST